MGSKIFSKMITNFLYLIKARNWLLMDLEMNIKFIVILISLSIILLEHNADCMHKAVLKIETTSYRASTTSEKNLQKQILCWWTSIIKLADTLVYLLIVGPFDWGLILAKTYWMVSDSKWRKIPGILQLLENYW